MTMQVSSSESAVVRGNTHDHEYDSYLARMNARFLSNVKGGTEPLFTTDAANGVWDTYLAALPEDKRQYHACTTCRRFVESFGTLVTIDTTGAVTPAVWDADDARGHEREAVAAVARFVRRAEVTGVFLSSDETWGVSLNGDEKTGRWRHPALTPPAAMLYRKSTLAAGQKAAEKREERGIVLRALAEFSLPVLETAVRLLSTDALYRSEKVLGQAEWLASLQRGRTALGRDRWENTIWRAVALAPPGFCHPRTSMIGTLLEDLAAGMDYDTVSKRFAEKMNPAQYQRPQAAPTAGALAAAEKLVETLGIERSLHRRFVRLDEVEALWRPAPPKSAASAAGGVFGHIQPKGAPEKATAAPLAGVPPTVMTFEKFRRTVLPTAERIEFYAPDAGSYGTLLTALHPDAPPILQWDSEEARNSVSWYQYIGGSHATGFKVVPRAYVDVEAVALKPFAWKGGEGKFPHQGKGVMFILAGARETRRAGNALFPEILKAEMHAVRSVIEAYARRARVGGMDEPHVAGFLLNGPGPWEARFRVTTGGQSIVYKLDRWD